MPEKLNVFLDDKRAMPPGYDVQVHSAEEAIALIQQGVVSFISLDNDLGEGKKAAQFIEQAYALGEIDFVDFDAHTSNPVARQEIMTCKANILKRFKERSKRIE